MMGHIPSSVVVPARFGDELTQQSAETREAIIDTILSIANDPDEAGKMAIAVAGEHDGDVRLSPVPGYSASILWRLEHSDENPGIVVLAIMESPYDELIESATIVGEDPPAKRSKSMSSAELMAKLQAKGFSAARTRGSHVVMKRIADGKRYSLVVPAIKEIPLAVARRILRQAEIRPSQVQAEGATEFE